MRTVIKVEAFSYLTLYLLGSVVAGVLSYARSDPLSSLVLHVFGSWLYVIYWVLRLA